MEIEITIYNKKVKNLDGDYFPVKKVSFIKKEEKDGKVDKKVKVFNVVMSADCKENFDRYLAKNDLHLPVNVELTKDNYFFTKAKNGYENFVMLGFTKLTQKEFEESKSIEDCFVEDLFN